MGLDGSRRRVNVLTVNAGSTSMKVALVTGGVATATFGSVEEAAGLIVTPPDAVAHRLVHGGRRTEPVLIDDAVREELAGLIELDPVHEPPELEALDHARSTWPTAHHIACFDTEFHATIPAAASHYALPEPWRSQLRAFGFHGLSHAWSARRIRALAPDARRVIIAHLGGGSSLCGVLDGSSCVTTMGFTPLDGLVMATRAGHIDPGAVLWLNRHAGEDVERLLTRSSGLTGLTGSGDMREILARAVAGDDVANFALSMWEHRFLVEFGGCVAALGGLDALVFTGGIGEHAADLRARLCDRLGWLGVNQGPLAEIHPSNPGEQAGIAASAAVNVYVVPAREDLILAEAAERLVAS